MTESNLQPAAHPLLRWFDASHLPPHLQAVVAPYARLAVKLAQRPSGAELTVALRKLLESKDAAVRAAIAEVESAGVCQDFGPLRHFRPESFAGDMLGISFPAEP